MATTRRTTFELQADARKLQAELAKIKSQQREIDRQTSESKRKTESAAKAVEREATAQERVASAIERQNKALEEKVRLLERANRLGVAPTARPGRTAAVRRSLEAEAVGAAAAFGLAGAGAPGAGDLARVQRESAALQRRFFREQAALLRQQNQQLLDTLYAAPGAAPGFGGLPATRAAGGLPVRPQRRAVAVRPPVYEGEFSYGDLRRSRRAPQLEGPIHETTFTRGDFAADTHAASAAVEDFAKKKTAAERVERRNRATMGGLTRDTANFEKGTRRASTAVNQIYRVLRSLAIAFVGFQAFRGIQRALVALFDFNRILENSRLGIAQITLVANRFADSITGAVPELGDQITASFALADQAIRTLTNDSIRLGIPIRELVDTFQTVGGVAQSAGLSFRESLEVLRGVSAVAQRLNIPFIQVARSVDNILKGYRVQQTQLGVILGLTDQIVQRETARGRLGEFLQERFQGVLTILEEQGIKTFQGLRASIQTLVLDLGRVFTGELFEGAKDALTEIRSRLLLLRQDREGIKALAEQFADMAKNIAKASKNLLTFIQGNRNLIKIVSGAGIGALIGSRFGATGAGAIAGGLVGGGVLGGGTAVALGAATALRGQVPVGLGGRALGGLASTAAGRAGAGLVSSGFLSPSALASLSGGIGAAVSGLTGFGIALAGLIAAVKATEYVMGRLQKSAETAVRAQEEARLRRIEADRAAASAAAEALVPGAAGLVARVRGAGRAIVARGIPRGVIEGVGTRRGTAAERSAFAQFLADRQELEKIRSQLEESIPLLDEKQQQAVRKFLDDTASFLVEPKGTADAIVETITRMLDLTTKEKQATSDLAQEQAKLNQLIESNNAQRLRSLQELRQLDLGRLDAQKRLNDAEREGLRIAGDLNFARTGGRQIASLDAREALVRARGATAEAQADLRGVFGVSFDQLIEVINQQYRRETELIKIDRERARLAEEQSTLKANAASLELGAAISAQVKAGERFAIEQDIARLKEREARAEREAAAAGVAAASAQLELVDERARVVKDSLDLQKVGASSEALAEIEKAEKQLNLQLRAERLQAQAGVAQAEGQLASAEARIGIAHKEIDLLKLTQGAELQELANDVARGQLSLQEAINELDRLANQGLVFDEREMEVALRRLVALARESFIDIGAELRGALTDALFSGQDGKQILRRLSTDIGRQIFGGILEDKKIFDFKIQKNFLRDIPAVAGQGGDKAGQSFFNRLFGGGGTRSSVDVGATIVRAGAAPNATVAQQAAASRVQLTNAQGSSAVTDALGNVVGFQNLASGAGASAAGAAGTTTSAAAGGGAAGGAAGLGGAVAGIAAIALIAIETIGKGLKAANAEARRFGATHGSVRAAAFKQLPILNILGEAIGDKALEGLLGKNALLANFLVPGIGLLTAPSRSVQLRSALRDALQEVGIPEQQILKTGGKRGVRAAAIGRAPTEADYQRFIALGFTPEDIGGTLVKKAAEDLRELGINVNKTSDEFGALDIAEFGVDLAKLPGEILDKAVKGTLDALRGGAGNVPIAGDATKIALDAVEKQFDFLSKAFGGDLAIFGGSKPDRNALDTLLALQNAPARPGVEALRFGAAPAVFTTLFEDPRQAIEATNAFINNARLLGISADETRRQLLKLAEANSLTLSSGIDELNRKFLEGRISLTLYQSQVKGLIQLFNEAAPAINLSAVALASFDPGSQIIELDKFEKRLEEAQRVIGEGLPAALQSAVEKQDFYGASDALAKRFVQTFNERLAEQLLQQGAIGEQLTQAAVLAGQAAEALAAGDQATFQRLIQQARQTFISGANVALSTIQQIAPAATGFAYSLGQFGGAPGIINTTGAGLPGFQTRHVTTVPGAPGSPTVGLVHGGERIRSPESEDAIASAIRELAESQRDLAASIRRDGKSSGLPPTFIIEGELASVAKNVKAKRAPGPNPMVGVR